MPERNERMLPTSTIASIALHAVLAVPIFFDLDIFDNRLDEPVVAFAVGMVPLSDVTAAPEVGEITPPRPLERLEEPAGNEAAEVETVDAEAPEQAPTAEAAPESQAAPTQVEEAPADAAPQVADADAPPPALTEAPDLPPDVAEPPEPAPPPDQADPALEQAPSSPAPDAPEVAALDAPTLPSEPQPEDVPATPAVPTPPLPPERTQAALRAETQPDEDEEDDEEPSVDAEEPPAPEQPPAPTELAALEVPPAPALTPQREQAPTPPTPPSPVVDNTAEPPEQTSAIDSVLQNLTDNSTSAASGQGTGTDPGTGGRSGSGTAAAGARLSGATLTLNEEEALRAQLRQCWNVPAGARDAENLRVVINAVMNPDRTVVSADFDSQTVSRMNSDTFYRTAAEAARRALFLCEPLALPQDKYQDWQRITFNFDPRDMF